MEPIGRENDWIIIVMEMVQHLTRKSLWIDQSKETGRQQVADERVGEREKRRRREKRKSQQRENRNVYTEIYAYSTFFLFFLFFEQNIYGNKFK